MNRFSILAAAPALALVLAAPFAKADSYGGVTPDYPPNARPGQCFARVVTPEVYSTYSEKVIDQAERTETRVLPGEFGWDEKTVCTKEPSVEYYTVPATYRTITETIVLKPASVRTETVPAVYGTTTRQVVVSEAHSVWKPGKGIASHSTGSIGGGAYAQLPTYSGVQYNGANWNGPTQVLPTGEVLCLVEVPAQYETITEQVVKTAARTVEIPVPAETQVVTRQVVDQPARVEKREIPGVYEKVRIRTVIRPEKVETYTVPATYRSVERKKLTSGGKLEWREVICDDKLNAPLPANAIPCSVAGGTCAPEYTPPPPVRAYTPPPVYTAPPKTAYVPHGPGEDCETCAATYDTLRPAGYKGGKAVTGAYGKGKVVNAGGGYVAASSGYASTTTTTSTTSTTTAAPAAAAQGGNMIARMQQALATRGYYKGPVNGLYTQPTSEALMSYQKDNHFAQGQLTLETARGLGIWN